MAVFIQLHFKRKTYVRDLITRCSYIQKKNLLFPVYLIAAKHISSFSLNLFETHFSAISLS